MLLGLLMQRGSQQVSEHVRGAKTFLSMLQETGRSKKLLQPSIHKLIVCKGITHDDMFKDDHDEGSRQYVPISSFLNMWGDLNKSHDVLARRKLANAFRPFLVDRSDETLSLMYLDSDQHCYCKYKGGSTDDVFIRRCIGMPDPDEVALEGFVVLRDAKSQISLSNLGTFDVSAYMRSLKSLKPGDRVTLFDQDPRQGVVIEVAPDGTTADVQVDKNKDPVRVELDRPDNVPISTLAHEFDPVWVFTRDMFAIASDPKHRDVLGGMLRPKIGQVMKQVLMSIKDANVCNLEDLRDHLWKRFGYDLDSLHTDHMLTIQRAVLDNVSKKPPEAAAKTITKNKTVPELEWGAFVREVESTMPDQPYERFVKLTRRGDYGLAHVIETSQRLKQAFVPKDSDVSSASNNSKFTVEDAKDDAPSESGRPFNVYDLYGDRGNMTWGSNVTVKTYRSALQYQKVSDTWMPSVTGPITDEVIAASYAIRERAVALLESTVSGAIDSGSEAFHDELLLHSKAQPQLGRRLDVFRAVVHTGSHGPVGLAPDQSSVKDQLDMDLDEIFNNMDNPLYYMAIKEEVTPKEQDQEEDIIGDVSQACQVQLTHEGRQFIRDNLDFYNNTDVLRQELQIQLQKLQDTQVVAEQKMTSGKKGLIDIVREKVRAKMIMTEQSLTSEHRRKSCLICLALIAILMVADAEQFASDLAQVDPGCVLRAKGKMSALDATKRYVECIAESMNLSSHSAISDYVELLLRDKPDLMAKCAAAKSPPWQALVDEQSEEPVVVEESKRAHSKNRSSSNSASKYVSLLSGLLSKQHQMATKYSLTALGGRDGGSMASAIGRDHKEMSKVMDLLQTDQSRSKSTGSTCQGTTVMRRQDDDDLVHAKATGDRKNQNKGTIAALPSWTQVKDNEEDMKHNAATDVTPPVLACGGEKGKGEDLYQNALADIKVIQDWLTAAGHSYSSLLLEVINGMSGHALHGYNQGCLMTTLSRLVYGFDTDATGGFATKKQFLGRGERSSIASNTVADPDIAIVTEVRSACGKDFDIMRDPLQGILITMRGDDVSLWTDVRVQDGGDAALHDVSTSIVARTLVALARIDFSSHKSPDVEALCRLSSASFRFALDESPKANVEGARSKLLEYFVRQLFVRARHGTVDMDDLRVSRQDARVVRDRDILKKMDVMDNELRSQVTQLKNMGLADWRGLVADLTIVPVEQDDEHLVSFEEPQAVTEREGDVDVNEDQEDDGEMEIEPEDIND